MTVITQERVDEVARAIARTQGNRKNSSTRYTDNYGNHCLVGQLLVGCGAPAPGPYDPVNEAEFSSQAVQSWLWANGVSIEPDAIRHIQALQDTADWGTRYGEQVTWSQAISDPYARARVI